MTGGWSARASGTTSEPPGCLPGVWAILNAADPRKLSQGLHHTGQLGKSWYFFLFDLPDLLYGEWLRRQGGVIPPSVP